MTDEPVTPNLRSLADSYIYCHAPTAARRGKSTAAAEFVRGINRVRANAVRQAAQDYPSMLRDMVSRGDVTKWLLRRADEIERGE